MYLIKSSTKDPDAKQIWYFILRQLLVSGCVDANVISSVIGYGLENALDDIDFSEYLAVVNCTIRTEISLENQGGTFNDTRCATAINAGLLKMCLKVLLRFRYENNGQICDMLAGILQGLVTLAFHPKTSKAINKVRNGVNEMLQNPELVSLARRGGKCGEIVDAIAFYTQNNFKPCDPSHHGVQAEVITCGSCAKVLEKDAIKRCR